MAKRSSRDARRGPPAVLVTCEHASARIPASHAPLFVGHERMLASHRGWDRDAATLAKTLARRLGVAAPLLGRVSRLLVDLNRPADDPDVFSPITARLAEHERAELIARHHDSHWRRVHAALEQRPAPVVHLAVHSFTPVRNGRRRAVDVGLLFDPARPREARLADELRDALQRHDRRLRVRFNEPYDGRHPGLTTSTRRILDDAHYAGLELELNQRFVRGSESRWRAVHAAVVAACVEVLGGGHTAERG